MKGKIVEANMYIRNKKSNILIYVAYIMINLYYGFTDTVLETEKGFILLFAALGLIFMHIVFANKYSIRELMIIIVLFGVLGYNYYASNDSRLLVLFVTICGIKELKLKNVLKITFYEKIITTLLVIVASFFGINSFNRASALLGYIHENLLMLTITVILLLYLCIYWEKINGIALILLLGIILVAYAVTGSRTGLLICVLVWILVFCYKYFHIEHIIEFLGKTLPFALMFFSIYMPLSMSRDLFIIVDKIPGFTEKYRSLVNFIDSFLNSRFTIANLVMGKTSIGLFGSVRDEAALSIYEYLVVDSGYVQLLLFFGILGSLIFLFLHHLMVKEVIKRKQYVYLIAIIAMALYAFTENSLCSLKYNFTLLFFVQLYNPIENAKLANKYRKTKVPFQVR